MGVNLVRRPSGHPAAGAHVVVARLFPLSGPSPAAVHERQVAGPADLGARRLYVDPLSMEVGSMRQMAAVRPSRVRGFGDVAGQQFNRQPGLALDQLHDRWRDRRVGAGVVGGLRPPEGQLDYRPRLARARGHVQRGAQHRALACPIRR
jgi:hypothetical protein